MPANGRNDGKTRHNLFEYNFSRMCDSVYTILYVRAHANRPNYSQSYTQSESGVELNYNLLLHTYVLSHVTHKICSQIHFIYSRWYIAHVLHTHTHTRKKTTK